jgi:hypothetical protein
MKIEKLQKAGVDPELCKSSFIRCDCFLENGNVCYEKAKYKFEKIYICSDCLVGKLVLKISKESQER